MRFNLKKTLAGAAAVAVIASVAPFVGSSAASAATDNNTLGALNITPPTGNSSTNISLQPQLNTVGARSLTNAGLTVGSDILTSPTGNFTSADLFRPVSFSGSASVAGAVAPAGARIIAVTNATTVQLSGSASAVDPDGGGPLTAPPAGTTFTVPTTNLQARPAACPGDSAGAFWNWSTFLVPASTDLNTLTFDGSGISSPVTGYKTVLNDAGGNPLLNQGTNVSGPGLPGLFSVPAVNFSLFAPGEIPAGVYRIGVACTQSTGTPPGVSPGQAQTFWARPLTITAAPSGGGPAQFTYALGAAAVAPTVTAPTLGGPSLNGDGSITVAFNPNGTSDPAVTSFTATATPQGGGAAVTASGAASPIVFPAASLTNGTTYDVTVTATNGVGTPTVSTNTVQFTPSVVRTPPVVTASPGGVGEASVTWTPAGGAPTSYLVSISPAPTTGSATQTIPASGPLAATFTNLGAGLHTVTVQAQGYPAGESAPAATDDVTVLGGDGTPATLIQTIQVDRAQVNAIVFEQDCGTGWVTTPCAVDMSEGTLDATGQYYPATGVLKPIRVIDARDTDKGWIVTANVADTFADGVKAFDSRALGWTPREVTQSPALGNGYTMTVEPGPSIAPWSPTSALQDGTAVLMQSVPAGGVQRGLGLAVYDATLSILVPISAPSGAYSADIVFTLVNKT